VRLGFVRRRHIRIRTLI